MSKKSSSWFFDSDPEPHTEKSLPTRLMEGVIVFSLACFVLKWGVESVLAVRVPLIIIAVIALIIFVACRVYKRRRHDEY